MSSTAASLKLVFAVCAALAAAQHAALRSTQRRLDAQAAPRLMFEPVDGGYGRACRGESVTDNNPQHYTANSSRGMSEEECKAQCRGTLGCTGIEFHPAVGRCEVWTRPEGVRASVAFEGSTCLRYEALARFASAGDGACRGAHENDNRASYFQVFTGIESQFACERQCLASSSCQGIEYHAGARRCEVWTRQIEATKPLDGYLCLQMVPAPEGCGAFDEALQDTDLAGTLLKEVIADSEAQCCSACGATDGCAGFSFLGQGCYLKSDITGTYHNPGCITRVKSLPGDCSGFSAVQQDTDLAGDLVAAIFATSAERCCGACDAAAGCEGWSYAWQTCYLKSNLTGTYSNPGCVTRVRESNATGSCGDFLEPEENKDLAGELLATKFALTSDHCCSACSAIAACDGYSYVGQVCYLKGGVIGTYNNPSSVARFRVREGNCTRYSDVREDTDIAGELIAEVFAPSVDLCCALCTAAAGCEGYVYFGRMCFLKAQVTGTYFNAGRTAHMRPAALVEAPATTTSSEDPVVPSSCDAYTSSLPNTDLAGDLIKEFHAPSEDDCCGACGSEEGCEGFSYLQEFNTCYLKRQLVGIFSKEGAVARVQRQPGNCDGFSGAPSDSDLSGDLLESAFALSAGGCCGACRSRADCQGFTFFSQVCYLKANVTSVWNNPGRVSLCLGNCPLR